MRFKRILLVLAAMGMAVLLAACVEKGPVQHVVTFYDGAAIASQTMVEHGMPLTGVPDLDGRWDDENGQTAEFSGMVVERDMAFYLWRAPALRTDHGLLMAGENGAFGPDRALTRGEAAQLIYSLIDGGVNAPAEPAFSDVTAADDCFYAVQALKGLGVMNGYFGGVFRPDQGITRGEFAWALFRLGGQRCGTATDFSDVKSDHWAAEAIAWCGEQGWLSGYPDGKFYPDRAMTRAETAAVLTHIRGDMPEHRSVDAACDGVTVYSDLDSSHWAFYDIIDVSYRNELLEYVYGKEGVEPGFTHLNGRLCHINADTLRIDCFSQGLQTVDGGVYYASRPGFFLEEFGEGLIEIEGSMFYVPKAGGPFLADDYFGYLYFGPDGRYTSGDWVVDEYVDDILSDILYNTGLSQSEKLYRAYCAIRDGGYNYRSVQAAWERGTTDWALTAAKYMYKNKAGSCYYWAAAFLYLARRLGYQAYPVCGGVGTANQLHAWVMVIYDDGEEYICDVELEWAYIHDFYHVSFYTTDMYLQSLNATHATYVFPGQTVSHYQGGYIPEDNDEDLFEIPDDLIIPPEEQEGPGDMPQDAPTDMPQDTPVDDMPHEQPPADTPADMPPADMPPEPPADVPTVDDMPME